MKYSIVNLREDFKAFIKGEKSNLAVKSNALSLLEMAKNNGETDVVNEIEDMLIDLEFSIAENKCNCHRGDSCCWLFSNFKSYNNKKEICWNNHFSMFLMLHIYLYYT